MELKYCLLTLLIICATFNTYSQEKNDTTIIITSSKQFEELHIYKDSLHLYKKYDFQDFYFDNDNYNGRLSIGSNRMDILASQKQTSGFRKFYSKSHKYILPIGLISYGIASQKSESLQEFDYEIYDEIEEHSEKIFRIDDYLQFAPGVAVFGLDIAGIKAENNIRDRVFVMTVSHLIMGVTVATMKETINKQRPDSYSLRSFPSGHTATAFTGAHILFKEYKKSSPLVGIAGYASSAATGILRIVNKKHWYSDVVIGAGIGIISAEIGYALLPIFQNIFDGKKQDKNLILVPSISTDYYGVGMAYTF